MHFWEVELLSASPLFAGSKTTAGAPAMDHIVGAPLARVILERGVVDARTECENVPQHVDGRCFTLVRYCISYRY